MRYILITSVFVSIACAKVTSNRVVFPDENNENDKNDENTKSLLKANSPTEQTNNKTHWCSPDNYPGNTISNLINQNSSLVELLEKDDGIRIRIPINTEPLQENICHTESEYILPKAAKNKKGKFMFIVNSPAGSEEYIQLVKVTTCKAARQECAQGQLLNSISTMCHQEYSDHKLVVLSETGEELVVDTFSFPSCCSCVFSNNHLELRRPARTTNFFC
eukprot:GFUD01105128.1.p1 GENE.GFUD01105128.1~~GFUD01105128.1.p1  ORF type:complete len:219 (-),score=53.49 GFUD01105128.1:74-730(-)